jgi:HPt (histidine-containing phosphotransfer) domain-containing protein
LPLDRTLLEGLFGADTDSIELMIGLFVDSLEPWRERLRTESERPALRALVHEIKGAASTVGAQPLAQSAAEFEIRLVGWIKEDADTPSAAQSDRHAPEEQAYRLTLLGQIDELLVWAARS